MTTRAPAAEPDSPPPEQPEQPEQLDKPEQTDNPDEQKQSDQANAAKEEKKPGLTLAEYAREAWKVVEPATPMVWGWHLDCVCAHLEAVSRGEIRDLLINCPPRHMKSLAVSVFWPTWEWTTRPARRWLYTSYREELSIRDALKSRRLIESTWYQDHWGSVFRLTRDQNQKARYENDCTGFRLSTSVNGGNTGEGADALIADDPHNVREAESDAVREGTVQWWREVMPSRRNDLKTGVRVVVMQCVHDRDVSGSIIAEGGYHHLNLPAEYEPKLFVQPGELPRPDQPNPHYDCKWFPDPRKEEGEPLWPERMGPQEIASLKRDLGAYAYAAQYQQRPVPRRGATFNSQDIQPLPANFEFIRPTLNVVQFYDLAWSERTTADYTAGLTLGIDPRTQHLYVLHVWRQRIGEQNLDEALAEQIAQQRPRLVGVEIGAFKQAATRDLVRRLNVELSRRQVATTVTAVPVSTDKGFRAQVPAGRARSGFVYADKSAPWWPAFEAELLAFPRGAHDDQVDAFSGATQLAIERGRGRSTKGVQMLFGERRDESNPRLPDSPAAYIARLQSQGWPGGPPDVPIRLPSPD